MDAAVGIQQNTIIHDTHFSCCPNILFVYLRIPYTIHHIPTQQKETVMLISVWLSQMQELKCHYVPTLEFIHYKSFCTLNGMCDATGAWDMMGKQHIFHCTVRTMVMDSQCCAMLNELVDHPFPNCSITPILEGCPTYSTHSELCQVFDRYNWDNQLQFFLQWY